VAFEEATGVVPDLARDSALSFAIAASIGQTPKDLSDKYSQAHAATLLVQGVTAASLNVPVSTTTTDPATKSDDGPAPVAPPANAKQMAPNVTLWPVSKEQLETLGEAHSPLGARVVSWVKEQVHAVPTLQQLPTISSSSH